MAPSMPPMNSDGSDDLPTWGIAVIAVVAVLLVAVLTCAIVMFVRERSGNPIFSTLEERTVSAKNAEVAMA